MNKIEPHKPVKSDYKNPSIKIDKINIRKIIRSKIYKKEIK